MKRGSQLVISGVLLVVETAVAFGIFFGAAYGLTRLAEHRAGAPAGADGDGVVMLHPNRATLHGGLTLYPTEMERRTEDYGNEYGRDLAEERRTRKIGNWKSVDDAAEWEFSVDSGGEYRVEIELAASVEDVGSEIAVTIGRKTVSTTVPDTGGRQEWKHVSPGCVKLKAGTHSLVLKATSVKGKTVMNVRGVVLRPVE